MIFGHRRFAGLNRPTKIILCDAPCVRHPRLKCLGTMEWKPFGDAERVGREFGCNTCGRYTARETTQRGWFSRLLWKVCNA